jgi:hypothetical protein
MCGVGLTLATQVIVWADTALEANATNRDQAASVTRHPVVDFVVLFHLGSLP